MNEVTIIIITELIGTIAFAVSGALIAVKCHLDLFGVLLVGCMTSVGGGIIRDILLGKFPPSIFSNAIILGVAAATSIIVFIISFINAQKFEVLERKIEIINNFFDAVGLASFSIIGTETACASFNSENALFAISMGLITGIGGGIMRDVLVDKTPYVLKKHIYALASILGSAAYYFTRMNGKKVIAITVAMFIIIGIRILSTKYHWKLPKVPLRSNNSKEIT